MIKTKKTEVQEVEEFLKAEGFTEIRKQEKSSKEFRDSLINISKLKLRQTKKK